ncbi:MAG: hypothetical protein AUG75_18925 [Cyanobacteria bacterium 13_1_20CM_4_61_6]|nr:MAG: hypothetical protein AUG75_18925 [Cyanobacteria bacterium 13_1_20CM_4_61_6]
MTYDIPGPREMLRFVTPNMMVNVGDVEAMCSKIISILEATPCAYAEMAESCRRVASRFRLEEIASKMLSCYHESLASTDRAQGSEFNN